MQDVIIKGDYKIAGFIEKNNLKKQESLGYPIIGSDDDLFFLRKNLKCYCNCWTNKIS